LRASKPGLGNTEYMALAAKQWRKLHPKAKTGSKTAKKPAKGANKKAPAKKGPAKKKSVEEDEEE